MHMAAAGHTLMAARVLEVLKAAHSIEVPELEARPAATRLAQLRTDALWARDYLGPWVGRRLRGQSSGDTVTVKYPELTHPVWTKETTSP